MKKQLSKILSIVMVTLLMVVMGPINAMADETESIFGNNGWPYGIDFEFVAVDSNQKIHINGYDDYEDYISQDNDGFIVFEEEWDGETEIWYWGYGNTSKAKLTVDIVAEFDDPSQAKYEWFKSNSFDGEDYTVFNTDESTAVLNADTSIISFDIDKNDDKTWFVCKVTGEINGEEVSEVSKAVQVLDLSHDDIDYCSDVMTGLYISNGKGAYTLGNDCTFDGESVVPVGAVPFWFNVLGNWEDEDDNAYWVSIGYDGSWTMYMKDADDNQLLDNVKSLKCSFTGYDTSFVVLDYEFENPCDAAIYTDVAIGSYDTFEDLSDNAAIKAILDGNDKLKSIQMLASEHFEDAGEDTCSFIFSPLTSTLVNSELQEIKIDTVSKFNVDAYNNYGYPEYYECEDKPNNFEYSFEDMLNMIFNYNTSLRRTTIYDYDVDDYVQYNPSFVRKTVKGVENVSVGLYGEDSVLSAAWENAKEVRFMFGVGSAGSFGDMINFTDVSNTPTGGGNNNSGNQYKTPDTSVR